MRISPVVVFALIASAVPSFANVSVTSPTNNTSVTSPVAFKATATTSTCSRGVASMGIYVDNQLKYVVNSTSMNASVSMTTGSHYVVVQEWDYCGGASKAPLSLNVVQPVTAASTTVTSGVAFGAVTVSSPTPGQVVTSPFLLSATNVTCEGQPVSTMAYSLDGNGTLLALTNATSLNAQVSASAGQHTLHVKSWGPNNAACDTDVTANVTTSATSIIPSNAIAVRNIQTFLNWKGQFDPATVVSGTTAASGTFSIVNSPSLSGAAMKFVTTYSGNGGELYYDHFAADNTSQNWFLDAMVYVASPNSTLANIEMDLNQVDSAGNTIIMGFQCDGWNSTWDYTYTDTATHWTRSSQPCNPRNWTANAWHHVQIWFSHDASDNVTYHAVWLDNHEQDINATVRSKLALGWANANILNFQIDGLGSYGTVTTYLDNVTVYRW
jgi:hypothetical protein